MATVVIAMCILKQALLATAYISPLRHLDWVRLASATSTMMRCSVISTWYPTRDRSYTILRSVIQSPIRASLHHVSPRKSHGRHASAWRQSFHRARFIPGALDAESPIHSPTPVARPKLSLFQELCFLRCSQPNPKPAISVHVDRGWRFSGVHC